MVVILRLSSTRCKEIRKQTVHIVGLCQIVAMLYNVRTKTFGFRKHVTVKRGNTPHSSICVTKATPIVVFIQETSYTAGLCCGWMVVEYIHMPSTETCRSPKVREIVGLQLMQGKAPFFILVDVIHPLQCWMNAAGFHRDTSEWRSLANSTDTSLSRCHNCSCGTTVW
jgi:hypothetical protein